MDLISRVETVAQNYPERIALKSSSRGSGISYGELNKYSASIYACLKEKSIGRDDVVVAILPRDWHMIVAAIAVWKAGACVTLIEDTYAKERIEFIKKDSNASMILDYKMFMDMMEHEPLYGHETAYEHDACFIVYTSGSTGNPKGVLHEYGKIGMAVEALQKEAKPTPEGSVFAMVAPLNFLASYVSIFYIYALGKCAYIMSYQVVKNMSELTMIMMRDKVSEVFMTPTFLKAYSNISPCIINVFMGGEACDNVFVEGPNLINCYASSESGMPVAMYVITSRLDKVPAGKSYPENILMILDEEGKPVVNGEVGEICVKNMYTRGYLNLPNSNAETFRDGICHMGDLGYIRADGNLMFSGRKDDMIKINGNRVEPGEVESVLRSVMKIENAVVKGFSENDRSFLCAYFIREELIKNDFMDEQGNADVDKVNSLISDYLPYYMLPTYYVILDAYPVNANGKIAKKELRPPMADDYQNEYVKPENETEQIICECFEKALGRKRVGIDDDFYLIGGDSISGIKLMSECRLAGLTIGDVLNLRTPRKLAKYYMEKLGTMADVDDMNRKALAEPQLLPRSVSASMYAEVSKRPDSTTWNLPSLFKIKKGTDADKLKAAVDKVFRSHPAFCTKAQFVGNGDICHVWSPDSYRETEIVYISEKDFADKKKSLVQPFNPIDSILCRKEIYVTEEAVYFFTDFFHTIADGTSLGIVLSQIKQCLSDDDYEIPQDYYYLILSRYGLDAVNGTHDGIRRHYAERYGKYIENSDFVYELRIDYAEPPLKADIFKTNVTKSKRELMLNPTIKSYYGNVFYVSMLLLAIACANRNKYAIIQIIYNGRNSAEKLNAVGMLIKSIPVIVEFGENETVGELLADVKSQIDYGIANCDIRFSEVAGLNAERSPFFLYQKDIFNTEKAGFIEESIPLVYDGGYCDAFIEYSVIDNTGADGIVSSVKYSEANYSKDTIEKLCKSFDKYVSELSSSDCAANIMISELLDFGTIA